MESTDERVPQHHTNEIDNKMHNDKRYPSNTETANKGDYGCHRLRWPTLRVLGFVGVSSREGSARSGGSAEGPARGARGTGPSRGARDRAVDARER